MDHRGLVERRRAAPARRWSPGPLVSRFYYVYAVDYDQGGVWGGKAAMCTRDKMFTIHGIEDCVARGFERSGFFEVDTGEQRSWTVQLTEPGQAAGTERAADAARAQGQDPRHPRTLLVGQGDHRQPVPRRRRPLPHQHEPHRPRHAASAGRRPSARSRPRSAGRSASSSTCRARSSASAPSPTAASTLTPGQTFTLDSDPTPGDATRVELPHPEIFAALEPGHRLLLDDGKVRLRVTECSPDDRR